MSNSTTPSASRSTSERAAGDRQPRLGLAVDDLELEPGLALDAGEELAAVLGRAAGLGGDQPRARDRRGCAACRAQIFSASTARSMAGSLRRPVADRPSPSRTMRENASTTRNWPAVSARATSSRQLLVPRSSAA